MRNKLIIAVLTLATFWVVFYYGFKRVEDLLWVKRKEVFIQAVDGCIRNASQNGQFDQDIYRFCIEEMEYKTKSIYQL